jgi:hypothetical protein
MSSRGHTRGLAQDVGRPLGIGCDLLPPYRAKAWSRIAALGATLSDWTNPEPGW